MPAIQIQRDGRAATLTLNRPPLNILDLATLAELECALAGLAEDAELTLLVLRGAGGRAFSAGAAVEDHTPDRVEAMLSGLDGAVRRLRALSAVTVAAVAGHCLGGGMELALACDLVVASDDARFGQPEVSLGCFPPVAAALYPSLIGPGRALDLLATGRTLTAEELERMGLIARRAPAGELERALAGLTAELTGKSAAVLRLIKRAVRAGSELPFAMALNANERLYRDELCATADMEEGIAAFLAKRRPAWLHR